MFALVVLFFCAIAAPISWKKVQFQDSLVWCGWEINFSHDTIQLMSSKLAKLDALIKSLLGSRRVPHKTLEFGPPALPCTLGPGWHRFTRTSTAHQAPCTQYHRKRGRPFEHPCQGASKLAAACRDCGSQRAPKSWKFQAAPCIALKTFRECLALAHMGAHRGPQQPIHQPFQVKSTVPYLAAADACAEDEMVGIGGWELFTTSWPLQLFVQLTAFWAHARNVLLQPTHVPGRCNDWADDLSRGRLARFIALKVACASALQAWRCRAEAFNCVRCMRPGVRNIWQQLPSSLSQPSLHPTWPSEPFSAVALSARTTGNVSQ